jgi:DNA-binding response OmpR family regulator
MAHLQPDSTNFGGQSAPFGVQSDSIRVLYVGRGNATIKSLRAFFMQKGDLHSQPAENPFTPLELAVATNQKTALHLIQSQPPKAVLVEIDARPDSRARFCEMVRYRLPGAAIFAVSSQEPNSSFKFDGFLGLPLISEQVIALLERIRDRFASYILQRGLIRLNIATRTVVTPSGQYRMTPKQCALLQMLMAHHGAVVTRSAMMQTIWETSYMEDTRTLDVHIRWLRERIEPDPSNPIYLRTVRGVGYQLRLT